MSIPARGLQESPRFLVGSLYRSCEGETPVFVELVDATEDVVVVQLVSLRGEASPGENTLTLDPSALHEAQMVHPEGFITSHCYQRLSGPCSWGEHARLGQLQLDTFGQLNGLAFRIGMLHDLLMIEPKTSGPTKAAQAAARELLQMLWDDTAAISEPARLKFLATMQPAEKLHTQHLQTLDEFKVQVETMKKEVVAVEKRIAAPLIEAISQLKVEHQKDLLELVRLKELLVGTPEQATLGRFSEI